MYKLFRSFLFLLSPERSHHFVMNLLHRLFRIPGLSRLFKKIFCLNTPNSQINLWGINFPNRIGLAAGFDKDGLLGHEWANLGFGFAEVGTVTPRAQEGNEKPRLFRLKQDEAIQNRMGFNNAGAEALLKQLRKQRPQLILGGNIGKNKTTPNAEAINDYLTCYRSLLPCVDFFTINVSSPNTPGLRELQEKEPLMQLLGAITQEKIKQKSQKPILLKIAPDLTESQLDDILEIVQSTGIDGLIATNTTLDREVLIYNKDLAEQNGAGGISGKPLGCKSTQIIRYLHQKSGGKIPIIGVGGIHSAEDALEKIEAGASLVQIYSGFIYEGPGLIKKINQALEQHFSHV